MTTTPDVVSLGRVAREHGISRDAYRHAMNSGLINPVDRGARGRGGGFRITREDAVIIATAAAVAIAAGLAFCIVLRVLREGSARTTPDGSAVIIPMPTPSKRAA